VARELALFVVQGWPNEWAITVCDSTRHFSQVLGSRAAQVFGIGRTTDVATHLGKAGSERVAVQR
jgi:hypothetical protein